MGLIAVLKRLFPGRAAAIRLADLLRQDLALLDQAIMGIPHELRDEDADQCRVIADTFTVTFTWDWRDQWITAEVRLHEARSHPLHPHLEHSARSWLEAAGLPTLPNRSGPKSSILLRDELEAVRRVVTQILSDDRKVREALFYLEGYSEGYNDRAVVPEDAPPAPVMNWTEERLRLRG